MSASEKNKARQERFKQILSNQSLGHAYLMEGPRGSGKKDFAFWLAQAIFCESPLEDSGPCQHCGSCLRVQEGNHPDLIVVEADGTSIKVDQVRDLQVRLARTGVESIGQVVIIPEAEKMTDGAANGLLKVLEEPERNTYLFLLTSAKNRILPTILSRCQVISFLPLSRETVCQRLRESGIGERESRILSYMTQDLEDAHSYYEDEDFQDVLSLMTQFYHYLMEKNDLAITFIHSDLLPLLKDRVSQEFALHVLTALFRIDVRDSLEAEEGVQTEQLQDKVQALSHLLEAVQYFQSHVPFQSSLEYLSLSILLDG